MASDFALNLIYLRGEKNLTQQELGDLVGVSPSQISRYESGTARPRKTVMNKLAEALGVTPESLSNPKMVRITVDEGDSDTWEVSLPIALKDRIQERADEFGETLEVMFLAELERAKNYFETGVDLGLEHHVRLAREYIDSLDESKQ